MKTFLLGALAGAVLGALWAGCYLYATQRPRVLVAPTVRYHMVVRYHSGGAHAHRNHRI